MKLTAEEKLKKLVERAYRDGLAYASNITVVDPDDAWRTSRVRSDMSRVIRRALEGGSNG